MRKAALYIRVSTEEQAKEGFSISAQREKLTMFACSQGFHIQDCYIDDGYSAKNTDRPALQRLLADVRQHIIDVVLVYRLDRLTRSVLDLYQLLEEFERYGATFRSCTEVYDTTTAIGRLFITLVAALAQWERENLAERVRLGMGQMAQEQKRPGGPPPYGFRLQKGVLVVDSQEAELVRMIFAKYLSGKGMNRIADELNQLGFRGRSGSPWNQTTLSHMLKNPAYYGALRWNYAVGGQKKNSPDTWIIRENAHEPIIDKETFQLVQKLQASRKTIHPRTLSSDFLFSGVLCCARCGSSMYGKTIRTRNQQGRQYLNRYYYCKNRKSKRCDSAAIREDRLEALFLPYLERYATSSDPDFFSANLPVTFPSRELLEKQLDKLRIMATRWEQAYAEGDLSLDSFRQKLHELQEQETTLLRHMSARLEQPSLQHEELLTYLKNFGNIWKHAFSREKKQLVSYLVKKIEADSRPLAITKMEFL
jgi:site-specific DNA recombinase